MVERLGIPTASIIASAFLKQAEVVSKGLGVPLAIGAYPGTPMVDGDDVLPAGLPEASLHKILIDNPLATYPRLQEG